MSSQGKDGPKGDVGPPGLPGPPAVVPEVQGTYIPFIHYGLYSEWGINKENACVGHYLIHLTTK